MSEENKRYDSFCHDNSYYVPYYIKDYRPNYTKIYTDHTKNDTI